MGYHALQACRLSGCSAEQLDVWARQRVVVPDADGEYGAWDLVALSLVRALLDAGVPLPRARRAVRALAEGDDLGGVRLVVEGERVHVCRADAEILDALAGSPVSLHVAVDRIAADVRSRVAEFDRDRQRFVGALRAPGSSTSPR